MPGTLTSRTFTIHLGKEGRNERLVKSNGENYCLIDRTLTPHGGAMEYCDVFSKVKELIHIKPMQNGFIERFNRSTRQAALDMYAFTTLNEVREQTEKWLKEYNEERPHDALGDLSPREFLLTQKPGSLYSWLLKRRVLTDRLVRRMNSSFLRILFFSA